MCLVVGQAFAVEGEEVQLGKVQPAKIELPKADYKGKESLIGRDLILLHKVFLESTLLGYFPIVARFHEYLGHSTCLIHKKSTCGKC